tara:strand:+ start:356 stop:565 length:210 start_codon:yes stop_codon:yes gene_type:complete
MKITSIQLVKTYNSLDKTLYLMQKDKGVSPFIFNKILDTRTEILDILINSLDGLSHDEITKTLNLIKRK